MAVTVVHYLAIALALGVGLATHTTLAISGIVAIGAVSAQLAMGIHQTNALLADASKKEGS